MSKFLPLLNELSQFVHDEQEANEESLNKIWYLSLTEKLSKGWTQAFANLERTSDNKVIQAHLGDNESRFREGDMLALHLGNITDYDNLLARHLTLEEDTGTSWFLRSSKDPIPLDRFSDGSPAYADPDVLSLIPFYDKAIKELAESSIGNDIVLPLLQGDLEPQFNDSDCEWAQQQALQAGFNAKQAQAVSLAFGAQHICCIQGPPGTGKTKVLALIAHLLVKERGERILLTSHTHMAINNALNKIQERHIPLAKIGRYAQRKGLDQTVSNCERMNEWKECPKEGGYVVGATPFATCSNRLQDYRFDTVIFDEASQITTPLAIMAMRQAKKFIFVGDQKQLPPVVLSKSVLDKEGFSVFTKLIQKTCEAVMLNETYRMNQWLTAWPSQTYYANQLRSAITTRERKLPLPQPIQGRFTTAIDNEASGIFISTPSPTARTRNEVEAQLIVELCHDLTQAGLPLVEVGIVSPFRAQGKAIRSLLTQRVGHQSANDVIADTVERMQGQERELVILSMASNDPVFLAAIAEFFFQPERLNVSITRAKTKLIVFGPEPQHIPIADSDHANQWISQYKSFVSQLQRVTL